MITGSIVALVTPMNPDDSVDWAALEGIRGDSADVEKLLGWLSESAEAGRILPFKDE